MAARNGGEEVILRVELCEDVFDTDLSGDRFRAPGREIRELVLLADRYMELRPSKGVIDEETFFALEEAASFSDAVRSGLRMLSFGANTKRGLETKLCQKGISREIAQEAVAHLDARGYISEEEDAVREAERNVLKLRGRNRIRAILYEKGYDSDAIRAAERYLDGVDFVEICCRLIEKRYSPLLSDAASQKKMAATLMRNGFTMGEIRRAIRTLASV